MEKNSAPDWPIQDKSSRDHWLKIQQTADCDWTKYLDDDSAENISDNSAELFERLRSNFVQRNFQNKIAGTLKLNFGNFP